MGTCGWAANFVLASASNSFELLFSAQGKADFRRSYLFRVWQAADSAFCERSNNCLAAFLIAYCVWQAWLGRKQKLKYYQREL